MKTKLLSLTLITLILLLLSGCKDKPRNSDITNAIESRIIQKMYAHPDSSMDYINEALAADSISTEHGIYLRAFYYQYLTEEKDSAIMLLEPLADYFESNIPKNITEKTEDNYLYTSFLILATKAYWQQGQYSYALNYAEKFSEAAQQLRKDMPYIAYDIECIRGNILVAMGNTAEGMAIVSDAVNASDKSRKFIAMHAHLNCQMNNLSLLHYLEQFDQMLPVCEDALTDVQNAHLYSDIPKINNNEAEISKFKDFYTGLFEAYRSNALAELGRTDEARLYLERSLNTNWGKFHRLTSISLIRTYSFLGMEETLDSAYMCFREQYGTDTLQERLIELLQGKARILEANNNIAKASLIYNKIYDIELAVHTERLAEQVQISDKQYKEKMAEKESRMKAEQKTIVWITHSIIFSLLLISILHIYYNNKKNKRMRLAYQALLEKQSIIDTNLKIISATASSVSANSSSAADLNAIPTENASTILFERIHHAMANSKPYLKDNFSINTLADILNTNTNYISRAINFCSGQTFPNWLAEYRNRIAIKAIQNNPNISINEICILTGHNTRETFSRQFKAQNGMSFSEFKEQIKKSNNC